MTAEAPAAGRAAAVHRVLVYSLAGCALAGALTGVTHAHPSPAEPPTFYGEHCVEVVDKQAQPVWHLAYAVLADDTLPEVDHIGLPDSKTHQFFAVAGAVFEHDTGHEVWPAGDAGGQPQAMPRWISQADVARAAANVTPEDMTNFTADQVAPQDVLEHRPELANKVLPFAMETKRVPITEMQSLLGADWPLDAVPSGVYQIAGYIFSPPYNGWAVRPGVLKVVDGADDPAGASLAAVAVRPVSGRVFAGQGLRVRGCVDAPGGSTLHIGVRPAGGGGPFERWGEPEPVEGAEFELCLSNSGRDALLEVRVELHGPDGELAFAYPAGSVSLFSTAAAACRPSETQCCPEGAGNSGSAMEPLQPQDAAMPDAAPPTSTSPPQGPVAGAPATDAPAAGAPAAQAPNPGEAQHGDAASASSCAVQRSGAAADSLAVAIWTLLLAACACRPRRKR